MERNFAALQTSAMHCPEGQGRRPKDLNDLRPCTCRQSRCLKLYCLCFHSGVFCNILCKCKECLNQQSSSKAVLEARSNVEARNPGAFRDKEDSPVAGRDTRRGCNCKKSRCLKKYCDCYDAGMPCSTDTCRCVGCLNCFNGDNTASPQAVQLPGAPPLRTSVGYLAPAVPNPVGLLPARLQQQARAVPHGHTSAAAGPAGALTAIQQPRTAGVLLSPKSATYDLATAASTLGGFLQKPQLVMPAHAGVRVSDVHIKSAAVTNTVGCLEPSGVNSSHHLLSTRPAELVSSGFIANGPAAPAHPVAQQHATASEPVTLTAMRAARRSSHCQQAAGMINLGIDEHRRQPQAGRPQDAADCKWQTSSASPAQVRATGAPAPHAVLEAMVKQALCHLNGRQDCGTLARVQQNQALAVQPPTDQDVHGCTGSSTQPQQVPQLPLSNKQGAQTQHQDGASIASATQAYNGNSINSSWQHGLELAAAGCRPSVNCMTGHRQSSSPHTAPAAVVQSKLDSKECRLPSNQLPSTTATAAAAAATHGDVAAPPPRQQSSQTSARLPGTPPTKLPAVSIDQGNQLLHDPSTRQLMRHVLSAHTMGPDLAHHLQIALGLLQLCTHSITHMACHLPWGHDTAHDFQFCAQLACNERLRVVPRVMALQLTARLAYMQPQQYSTSLLLHPQARDALSHALRGTQQPALQMAALCVAAISPDAVMEDLDLTFDAAARGLQALRAHFQDAHWFLNEVCGLSPTVLHLPGATMGVAARVLLKTSGLLNMLLDAAADRPVADLITSAVASPANAAADVSQAQEGCESSPGQLQHSVKSHAVAAVHMPTTHTAHSFDSASQRVAHAADAALALQPRIAHNNSVKWNAADTVAPCKGAGFSDGNHAQTAKSSMRCQVATYMPAAQGRHAIAMQVSAVDASTQMLDASTQMQHSTGTSNDQSDMTIIAAGLQKHQQAHSEVLVQQQQQQQQARLQSEGDIDNSSLQQFRSVDGASDLRSAGQEPSLSCSQPAQHESGMLRVSVSGPMQTCSSSQPGNHLADQTMDGSTWGQVSEVEHQCAGRALATAVLQQPQATAVVQHLQATAVVQHLQATAILQRPQAEQTCHAVSEAGPSQVTAPSGIVQQEIGSPQCMQLPAGHAQPPVDSTRLPDSTYVDNTFTAANACAHTLRVNVQGAEVSLAQQEAQPHQLDAEQSMALSNQAVQQSQAEHRQSQQLEATGTRLQLLHCEGAPACAAAAPSETVIQQHRQDNSVPDASADMPTTVVRPLQARNDGQPFQDPASGHRQAACSMAATMTGGKQQQVGDGGRQGGEQGSGLQGGGPNPGQQAVTEMLGAAHGVKHAQDCLPTSMHEQGEAASKEHVANAQAPAGHGQGVNKFRQHAQQDVNMPQLVGIKVMRSHGHTGKQHALLQFHAVQEELLFGRQGCDDARHVGTAAGTVSSNPFQTISARIVSTWQSPQQQVVGRLGNDTAAAQGHASIASSVSQQERTQVLGNQRYPDIYTGDHDQQDAGQTYAQHQSQGPTGRSHSCIPSTGRMPDEHMDPHGQNQPFVADGNAMLHRVTPSLSSVQCSNHMDPNYTSKLQAASSNLSSGSQTPHACFAAQQQQQQQQEQQQDPGCLAQVGTLESGVAGDGIASLGNKQMDTTAYESTAHSSTAVHNAQHVQQQQAPCNSTAGNSLGPSQPTQSTEIGSTALQQVGAQNGHACGTVMPERSQRACEVVAAQMPARPPDIHSARCTPLQVSPAVVMQDTLQTQLGARVHSVDGKPLCAAYMEKGEEEEEMQQLQLHTWPSAANSIAARHTGMMSSSQLVSPVTQLRAVGLKSGQDETAGPSKRLKANGSDEFAAIA